MKVFQLFFERGSPHLQSLHNLRACHQYHYHDFQPKRDCNHHKSEVALINYELIQLDQDHQEYHRCHFHDCNLYGQILHLQQDHQCLCHDPLLKVNCWIYFFCYYVFFFTRPEYRFAKEYHQEDSFPKQKKLLILDF